MEQGMIRTSDGKACLLENEDLCRPPALRTGADEQGSAVRAAIGRLTPKQISKTLWWIASDDPAAFEKAVYWATTRYPARPVQS